jgi:hypothetical protein
MVSPLNLYFEDNEEEAVPDMKALTGSGGDLPHVGVLAGNSLMVSPLTLYSEDKEEEEAVPDMKVLKGSGGDLPQEFWQVTVSWSPPLTLYPLPTSRYRS